MIGCGSAPHHVLLEDVTEQGHDDTCILRAVMGKLEQRESTRGLGDDPLSEGT